MCKKFKFDIAFTKTVDPQLNYQHQKGKITVNKMRKETPKGEILINEYSTVLTAYFLRQMHNPLDLLFVI